MVTPFTPGRIILKAKVDLSVSFWRTKDRRPDEMSVH